MADVSSPQPAGETAQQRLDRLVTEGRYPEFRAPSGVEKAVRVNCYVDGITIGTELRDLERAVLAYDKTTAPLGSGGQEYSEPGQTGEHFLELIHYYTRGVGAAMFRAKECGLGDMRLEDRWEAFRAASERPVPNSGTLIELLRAVTRRVEGVAHTPYPARHTIPRRV